MASPTEDWALIERLFESAADLPPAAQSAFLDAECGGDPVLRAEIESLLAADTRDTAAIEAAVGSEAQALLSVEGTDLTGSHVGPYRIIRQIGRGGMGSVYLAVRDDDQYRKEVAIKLIRHGMDTEDVLDRFRHERQILANLDHPYIARLLDGGTSGDGRPFFVMEYVTGKTLDVWSRDLAPDDVAQRLDLFLKICEAVSYAHRQLVVHRDLKPANIFVTPDGSPKLLDFGVAKLLETDLALQTTATIFSSRPLTPDYASPEQVRAAHITTATDVYSLGAILYELLAGKRAHQFNSYAPREVERVVCEADPPALGSLAHQLKGDLEAIVAVAMRKEQDRRYQLVDQMVADIRAYRNGRPVVARQGNFSYRAAKYLRRHRTPIAVGILFAVALVGGSAIATIQAIRANREQALAEKERGIAVQSQLRAEASQRNAERQRGEADAQRSLAEKERQLADQHFDEVRQLAGKFLLDFHSAIANLPGATPARKMVVETGLRYYDMLVREAAGNQDVLEEVARGYDSLGDVQGNPYFPNLGDVPGAIASYRRAMAIRSGVSGSSPAFLREKILGQVKLSQVLVAHSDFKAAEQVNVEAIALGEKTLSALPADVAGADSIRGALSSAYSAYGDLKIRLGLPREAEAPYLKLLALANLSAQDAGLSLAHTKLGDDYYRLGRSQESVNHLRAALEIDRRLAAANPASMALTRKLYVTYSFLGRVLHTEGGLKLAKPGEVREYLVGARDLADQMHKVDPDNLTALTDIAMAETGLGDWLVEQKDPEGAMIEFAKSIVAAEQWSRVQPITAQDMLVQAHHRMATALFEAARYDQALEHVAQGERYLSLAEKQNPGVPRNSARKLELHRIRADVYTTRKQWEQAVAEWLELISLAEEQATSSPRYLDDEPLFYMSLADCYFAQGRKELAVPAMQNALDHFGAVESRRALTAGENTRRQSATAKLADWQDRRLPPPQL